MKKKDYRKNLHQFLKPTRHNKIRKTTLNLKFSDARHRLPEKPRFEWYCRQPSNKHVMPEMNQTFPNSGELEEWRGTDERIRDTCCKWCATAFKPSQSFFVSLVVVIICFLCWKVCESLSYGESLALMWKGVGIRAAELWNVLPVWGDQSWLHQFFY